LQAKLAQCGATQFPIGRIDAVNPGGIGPNKSSGGQQKIS